MFIIFKYCNLHIHTFSKCVFWELPYTLKKIKMISETTYCHNLKICILRTNTKCINFVVYMCSFIVKQFLKTKYQELGFCITKSVTV